jgi:hypothetical protein
MKFKTNYCRKIALDRCVSLLFTMNLSLGLFETTFLPHYLQHARTGAKKRSQKTPNRTQICRKNPFVDPKVLNLDLFLNLKLPDLKLEIACP